MLVIRAAQMQRLQAEMDRAFADRLARAIESCFPDYFKATEGQSPRREAKAVVAPLIERAESFGIHQERDIAAYAALAVAALEFDEASHGFLAWTHPIITSQDIAGAAKIPLVQCRLEREARADPRAAHVLDILHKVRGTD